MKSCPACQRAYDDDAMSFCLDDGTPLVNIVADSAYDPGATLKIPAARLTSDAPTEILRGEGVAPGQAAPQAASRPMPGASLHRDSAAETITVARKSGAAPWILGAAVVLGLSAIAVAFILTRGSGTDNSQVAQSNQTANMASMNSMTETEARDASTGNMGIDPSPVAPAVPSTAAGTPERTAAVKTQEGPTPRPAQTPAQTPRPTPERTPESTPPPQRPRGPISGGVLNGKAISKPAPSYPAIARAARASGTVNVQVMIDESGRVTSARAVSGHPLLQQSAVQAAYQARFSPTLLSGQPVKVTGVITYNFIAQ
jgi:TonB family protein